MPIYGYSICFDNKKQMSKAEHDLSALVRSSFPSINTIVVQQALEPIRAEAFSIVTEWYDMSGQKARYCANMPFSNADERFSWGLDVKGIMTLLWDPLNRSIFYTPQENFSEPRLRFWIYHTFFPMVLELMRRYTILHVGAVDVEGVPILFSAPSFGGLFR